MTNKENITAELIDELRDIKCEIRDLIELLKSVEYNLYNQEDNRFLVEYMNIDNEKGRIVFELQNNISALEKCVEYVENEKISLVCKDLIQKNDFLLQKFN